MKFEYFDALEQLAIKCTDQSSVVDAEANELVHHLATDFITPIDRADIAAVTLSLRRCAEAGRHCTVRKSDQLSGLCEAVVEYTRALRSIGKKSGVISAKLYFECSAAIEKKFKSADERRFVDALCSCCETLIRAALNNI